jgi:hypothetical protein
VVRHRWEIDFEKAEKITLETFLYLSGGVFFSRYRRLRRWWCDQPGTGVRRCRTQAAISGILGAGGDCGPRGFA